MNHYCGYDKILASYVTVLGLAWGSFMHSLKYHWSSNLEMSPSARGSSNLKLTGVFDNIFKFREFQLSNTTFNLTFTYEQALGRSPHYGRFYLTPAWAKVGNHLVGQHKECIPLILYQT